MSQSKAVLWTSGALAAAQGIYVVIALVSSRFLGPAGKGLVNAVTTWTQLLGWIAVLGLGNAAQVRLSGLAKGSDEIGPATRMTLGNSLAYAGIVGVPVTVVGGLVVMHVVAGLGGDAQRLTMWSVAPLPLTLVMLILLPVQVSLGRRRVYNTAQLVGPMVTLLLMLAFLAGPGLTSFRLVLAYVAGSVLALPVAAWGLPWSAARVSLSTFVADLKFGVRLHTADLLRLTSLRLDVLLMAALVPAVEIGLYGAANSAMMPVMILASGSSALITARVASMAVSDAPAHAIRRQQARAILHEAGKYTLISAAGGLGIAALAPALVRLVLGPAYAPAIRLIWLLLPGYICLGFSSIAASGAEGMRRPWIGVVAELAGAALTILLLPPLLRHLGAAGAALVSTAAYALSAIIAGTVLAAIQRAPVAAPPPGNRVGGEAPQVSVLLAAFRPDYLRAAVDSVLAQTYPSFELLVLDDSSDHQVAEIARGRGDPRVRVLQGDRRLGAARNHDRGIRNARAARIAIINHDDQWEPQMLEELVCALDAHPGAVVAFGDHWIMDANGTLDAQASAEASRRWGREGLAEGLHQPFGRLALFKGAIPVAQCALWDRSVVEAIPSWAGDRYDYWLQVKLASSGRGAVYVPRRLARFRVHRNNLGLDRGLRRRVEAERFYRHLVIREETRRQRLFVLGRYFQSLIALVRWPLWKLLRGRQGARLGRPA